MNQNQTLNAKYFKMFQADFSNSFLQKHGFTDNPLLIYVYYRLVATNDGNVTVESKSKSLKKHLWMLFSWGFLWI